MLETRQLMAQGNAHQVWPPACQGHQQLCQSDTKADFDQPHTVLPGSTSCHYGRVLLVKLATSSCANQIQRRILANIKLCFPEAPVAIMEMCCLRSWPTRNYTWPGSSWRPSACGADVIATRPQVLMIEVPSTVERHYVKMLYCAILGHCNQRVKLTSKPLDQRC